MSNGGVAAGAAAAAAAAARANAVKASGAIVRVEEGDFLQIFNRAEQPKAVSEKRRRDAWRFEGRQGAFCAPH